MTNVLAFPTIPRRPPPDILRPQMTFGEIKVCLDRALFAATRGDAAAAARAIQFMRHVAEFAGYDDARRLAARYLRWVDRPDVVAIAGGVPGEGDV